MTFQLIYFAAERDEALEERLSALGETETRSGETRKAFLLALSEAFPPCRRRCPAGWACL